MPAPRVSGRSSVAAEPRLHWRLCPPCWACWERWHRIVELGQFLYRRICCGRCSCWRALRGASITQAQHWQLGSFVCPECGGPLWEKRRAAALLLVLPGTVIHLFSFSAPRSPRRFNDRKTAVALFLSCMLEIKRKRSYASMRNSLIYLVEMSGIEPLAYALRTHRSPN